MKVRLQLLLIILLLVPPALGQVNQKGDVHLSIGLAAGGHATRYETTFLGFVQVNNDGAATSTIPIEVGYGLGGRFSLGLLIEPGLYLDSTETESNALRLFALQPRFYLVNGERFAWMASLQLGGTGLTYDVDQPGNNSRAIYRGGFVGVSTGIGMYFTDNIGLNLHLRYMSTSMPLREWEVNGVELDPDLINARLSTSGIALQASLAFKF